MALKTFHGKGQWVFFESGMYFFAAQGSSWNESESCFIA